MMKKWKKFMAIGLAVSMITPSCMPHILWASEFSSGSSDELVSNTFDNGFEADEEENKAADKNSGE